jgi:hypothetical protein
VDPEAIAGMGPVVHLACADLVKNRCVQRVGRQRHQHFVARIGQRRQDEIDALRRSGRHHDAAGMNRPTAAGVLVRDRFTRGRQADGRAVAMFTRAEGCLNRFDHRLGRTEAECHRIPGVEVVHARSRGLGLLRLGHDSPNGIGHTAHPGCRRYER